MGISDDLWKRIEPLIPTSKRTADKVYRRRPGGGRKTRDRREVFEAVLHVLQTHCAWHELPPKLGSVSTVNRHFRRWEQDGLFVAIWAAGLAEHPELLGIHWTCELNQEPDPVTPRWRPVHGGRRGRPRKGAQRCAAPIRHPAPRTGTDTQPATTDTLAHALRLFISRRG